MSKIVQFDTKNGPIFVEVDSLSGYSGEVLAATDSAVISKAKKSFEDALATVKPGIEEALDLLTSLVKKPNETEIEFGLKIDAAAGAIFAKAGAEATFKIKLTWK
jgi:NTP-dependent ternary system trypsin peptidase co-occuring protein